MNDVQQDYLNFLDKCINDLKSDQEIGLIIAAIIFIAILVYSYVSKAEEYIDQKHWFVVADVCDFNDKCEHKNIPVESDNEVACQMTSWKYVQQWVLDHQYRSWSIVTNCTLNPGENV